MARGPLDPPYREYERGIRRKKALKLMSEMDAPSMEGKRYRIGWIGIDQSYKRLGVSMVADNDKVLYMDSVNFVGLHYTKRDVRVYMREKLPKRLAPQIEKCAEVGCVIERIRTFSSTIKTVKGANAGKRAHISMNYITSMAALNAAISDTFYSMGIPTFSVDTRAWKAKIVGTALPEENDWGCPPNKWPTVRWAMGIVGASKVSRELPSFSKRKKDTFTLNGKRYVWDDDMADSLGIAMFGLRGHYDLLKPEY